MSGWKLYKAKSNKVYIGSKVELTDFIFRFITVINDSPDNSKRTYRKTSLSHKSCRVTGVTRVIWNDKS